MKSIIILTFLSFALVSCNTAVTGFDPTRDIASEDGGGINPGGGNGAGQSDDPLQDAIDNAVESPPVVEIRHLVEPKVDSLTSGGAYLKKLTLPKDYRGKLYLAGINISTLHGKNVKVRFKLGRDKNPIVIPADVAVAPGLTAGSNVSVLAMDLRHRPFENLRLRYDLYDYNDYTFDGSNASNALDSAVSYNRDTKLYCRGLNLEDDPTYTGSSSDLCDQGEDICKYAYAKVVDQGLTYEITGGRVSINPSRAQIQSTGSSYDTETHEEKLDRCLPDNPVVQQAATGVFFRYDDTTSFASFAERLIDGILYRYEGPYRQVSPELWEITANSNASVNKYGLFNPDSGLPFNHYKSMLYPRYVKYNLGIGTEYLGSATPDGAKTVRTMPVSGETDWMDGCNERATTYNPVTAEHVGSCDVSAQIEVFYTDQNNTETVIAVSNDVKIQLVKESNEDPDSTDVISDSFRACSSTSQCGGSECCINNRCWDKTIVSSCVEDEPTYGNEITGSTCSSDYECASLCCQGGTCKPHDENQAPPVLCSKQVGQSCVAKDWCAKQPVTRCFIVKTGVDPQGGQQCALRCYTNPESGECRNGSCAAPTQPEQPVFDETDPNRCDNACDPPDFSNGFFSINCGGN